MLVSPNIGVSGHRGVLCYGHSDRVQRARIVDEIERSGLQSCPENVVDDVPCSPLARVLTEMLLYVIAEAHRCRRVVRAGQIPESHCVQHFAEKSVPAANIDDACPLFVQPDDFTRYRLCCQQQLHLEPHRANRVFSAAEK